MANGPRKELSFLDRALMNKAATQGGVLNFLGQQPQVTAPIKAQSHADSPPVQLAYITDAEKDLLVKSNIHGSLAGKPNPGPAGIPSLDDFFNEPDGTVGGDSTADQGASSNFNPAPGFGSTATSGGGVAGSGFVPVTTTLPGQTQSQTFFVPAPESGSGSGGSGGTDQNDSNQDDNTTTTTQTTTKEEETLKNKVKAKVKKLGDWFDKNVFGDPIEEIDPSKRQEILDKLKEFKELDVGIFQNFMLNRGNVIAGLFGKDQTFSDMQGNIIDPKNVVENPTGDGGLMGLNEDGEYVDIRYTKEGFNDLMEDTFGKGIFKSLEKYEPQAYYPYAGMPQTSGGLVNLAGIDATKFGSRTLPDGSPNPNYNPDFANMIFSARAELDRMGKNPMTGNPQGGGQVAGFPGIPGIPSLPVPRPGPIPPDSYPIFGPQPPFMPGPIPFPLPGPGRPPFGDKFEQPRPYNYFAQSPQYRFRGIPSVNTNAFNEELRNKFGMA